MDIFEDRCYRINKRLLSYIGQWPYQSTSTRRAIVTIMACFAGSQFVAKILGLLNVLSDTNLIIKSLSPMIVDIGSLFKIVGLLIKSKQVKLLVQSMQNNWSSIKEFSELNILRLYAENGKKFTITYVGAISLTAFFIMFEPILSIMINTFNETDDRPLLHNVEYYVDPQDHYYPILLHSYFCIISCCVIVIAVDTMFVAFIQHACALFDIVGQKLKEVSKDNDFMSDLYPRMEEDLPYQNIRRCVSSHNAAIEFAGLIEEVFSGPLFWQSGFNMIIISFTGVQAVTYTDKPEMLITQFALAIGLLSHLFFESYHSQCLLDHSAQIHEDLLNTQWYKTSFRTRKIVCFMIMKSQFPSVLTASGMYVVSMETFSMIVRTSVSYFTVLRSVQ